MYKKIFYLHILTCTCLTAFAQNSFTVTGKLPPSLNGTVIYLASEQNAVTDSTTIRAGQFSFNENFSEPSLWDLSFKTPGYELALIQLLPASKERIEIELPAIPPRKNLLEAASVKGSQFMNQLNEFNDYTKTSSTVNDSAMQQSLVKSFINLHPDYYVSLVKFRDLVMEGIVVHAEKRFEHFSPALQQSALGVKVKDLIERLQQLSVGQLAPELISQTTEGKLFRLSDMRGKYVLLDFWASWCAPCRAENPNVVQAYKRFRNKNFDIVSFSLDESKKSWLAAIEQDGLTWQHVSDLKAWQSDVVRTFMINSVPQSFLLGPDGKIIASNLRGDMLEKQLEKIFQ